MTNLQVMLTTDDYNHGKVRCQVGRKTGNLFRDIHLPI